jgi:hypothetical protein
VAESRANSRKVGRRAALLERKWFQPSKPGKTRKELIMTRFTKCLTAAAVVVGFGLATQSASAAPPTIIVHPTILPNPGPFPPRPYPYPIPRHDHDYVVLYKSSPFGGWLNYGRFETRYGAENAIRRLEWQGFATRIVRVHDYNGNFPW